jgi:formylglycine-generating enzyme required for sulfatase activity
MFSRCLFVVLFSNFLFLFSVNSSVWAVDRGLITIDFDLADGDQGIRVAGGATPGKTYDLQLYYRDILQIIGWSITIEYDPNAVRYVSGSFQPTDYIPGLLPLVDEQTDYVAVGGTLLGSGTSPTEPGSVGTLSFEIQEGFSDSTHLSITINEFRFEEGGSEKYDVFSAVTITDDEELRGDFDSSGKVDFTDFFAFADAFGTDDRVYDLDSSGGVDFDDFFIFADNFGKELSTQEPVDPDPQPEPQPEPSDTLGQDLTVDLPGGATMEFVWVDPGTFVMGSPETEVGRSDDQTPQHEVTISQGFYLGKYEITQGQWEAVTETAPWVGADQVRLNPIHPAVNMSWNEVQAFVHQLNVAVGDSLYRLPTEAEWEYACRAGTTTPWSSGDDESLLKDYAWYSESAWNLGLEYAQPVGAKLPNPWGLFDMHGNVLEFCQDWYGPYTAESQTDPTGPTTGSVRIIRSGYYDYDAPLVRSAFRERFLPHFRQFHIGGRLLRMANPIPLLGQEKITVRTPADLTHEMVLIPEGEFTMGTTFQQEQALGDVGSFSAWVQDERPAREVALEAYYIDKYEVTNAQYQAFVRATGRAPSKFADDSEVNTAQQAVVGVNFYDALSYCEWAGLHLPTEEEWEKAARGTDGRVYPWGNEYDCSRLNGSGEDCDGYVVAAPVGSFPVGVSPYGAMDMAGNAWEWTTGENGEGLRTIKGGSWHNDMLYHRSATRYWLEPDYPGSTRHLGFRCARDMD